MSNTLQITLISLLANLCLYCPQPAFAAGSDNQNAPIPVSLTLPGAVSDVHGVVVNALKYGGGGGDLMTPQRMTIHFLDGTTKTLVARSSTISCIDDGVAEVLLRRPLTPVSFKEGRADLLSTLRDIDMPPDGQMNRQMSTWPEDAKASFGFAGFGAGTGNLNHGVLVGVRFLPDPTGGWFYLLSFDALKPGDLSMITPATQPVSGVGSGRHDVSVNLPGKTGDVIGADVRVTGRGMEEVDLPQPQKFSIHCSDGAVMSIDAQSLSIICFNGVVRGVFIRRPAQAVTYAEAKADILKAMAELNVVPDDGFTVTMNDLPVDVPASSQSPATKRNYLVGNRRPVHNLDLSMRLSPESEGTWSCYIIFDTPFDNPVPSTEPTAPTAKLPQ